MTSRYGKLQSRTRRAIFHDCIWSEYGLNVFHMQHMTKDKCRSRVKCRLQLVTLYRECEWFKRTLLSIIVPYKNLYTSTLDPHRMMWSTILCIDGVSYTSCDERKKQSLTAACLMYCSKSTDQSIFKFIEYHNEMKSQSIFSIGHRLPRSYTIRCIDHVNDLTTEDIRWFRGHNTLALDTEGIPPRILQIGNFQRCFIFAVSNTLAATIATLLNVGTLLITWGHDELDVSHAVFTNIQEKDVHGKLVSLKTIASRMCHCDIRKESSVFYRAFDNDTIVPSQLSTYRQRYAAADVYFTFQRYQHLLNIKVNTTVS